MEFYDPQQHSPNRSLVFRAGQDPGVACTVHAAWTLWLLGYPGRAAARMREALTFARSLTRLAWPMLATLLLDFTNVAESAKPYRNKKMQLLRIRLNMVLGSFLSLGRSIAAGYSLNRRRERKVSPKCARDWRPIALLERNSEARHFLHSWPRRMRKSNGREEDGL